MSENLTKIKARILEALSHPEAEEGLYFNNLIAVHEVEERPVVEGAEEDILAALKELIDEGAVITDESQKDIIFKISVN